MSRLEDGLREVLTERAGPVMPPTGWEQSVLVAGRRRLLQRRMGATFGAALAVFAVIMAANVILPHDWAKLDASAPMNGVQGHATGEAAKLAAEAKPIMPATLRPGVEPSIAYAAGDASGPPGDVVVLPDGQEWETDAYVTSLEQAGTDGVVAELSSQVNTLMYRWSGGTRELARGNLAGFAVSADGASVAWTQVGHDGGLPAVLYLAELPSGTVVESTEVKTSAKPGAGVPFVSSFVGDAVTLSYDATPDQSPPGYAWYPSKDTIQSMDDDLLADKVGKVVDVSARTDTMLLIERDGCLANVSLKNPGDQRWQSCDQVAAAWPASKRLSPRGTRFAGVQGSLVWVRDALTGRLLWSREIAGATADAVVWESEDRVLVTYDEAGDTGLGRALLRCQAELPACDRPATTGGFRVTALASRQGTDPPIVQR
jgi:hypothetical protein